MRRFGALLMGVALAAAACSDESTSSPTPATDAGDGDGPPASILTGDEPEAFSVADLQFVARLETLGDCDALLAHLRTEALARVGPYGLDGYGGWYGPVAEGDVATDGAEAAGGDDGAAGAPATTAAGDEFSGTNTAEAGVDEADIVKTDGERVYAVHEDRLVIVDVTSGAPERLGSVSLEGDVYGGELLLAGDRAYVVAQTGGFAIPLTEVGVDRLPHSYGSATTVVQEVDVSDPSAPVVVRTLTVDGSYVSVRVVDDVARIVLSAHPSELPFVYPANEAGEDRAEAANREVVAESTLDQWLPAYTLEAPGQDPTGGLLLPCDAVHAPTEFAGFGTTSVLTLPLGGGLGDPVDGAVGVLAPGSWVYASTENLYVATASYVPPEAFEQQDWDQRAIDERYGTSIHRFGIGAGGPAEYQASGSVPGHLLNDLSLSELDGDLRVATTLGSPWSSESSESSVTVLRRDGDQLVTVGQVDGLGEGERIYAVRFVGTNAYVVTFRQTDPFYVVDLSDPTAPVVRGELKIPGYSGYLHRVGDGLVLGVGQEGTESGVLTGLKVSLFDVSDPAAPVELDTWTYDGRYSQSVVEYDRKAFLWWEPEQLAVIPVNDWDGGFNGVVALRVTPEGVAEVGRVAHDDDQLGRPGCDVVDDQTLEDLGYSYGPGTVVQVCGPEQEPDIAGYECYEPSLDEIEAALGELPEELQQGDVVQICYPPSPGGFPIQRSIVIGDALWTLSYEWLQGNALADLADLGRVDI